MFKYKSAAEDIAKVMQENLVSSAVEESGGFNKIAKALDHLNAAADLFDDAGLLAEAEILTYLLESLAAKKDSEKSKNSKDPKNSKDSKNSKESFKDKMKRLRDLKNPKSKKSTKKEASEDPHSNLTSEQMLENLKTNGTVFNYGADDGKTEENADENDADDADDVVEFEDE